MTKDGLPGEASQEGQSRPVSLAGLVLVLCVALMGVMGVSITLPILPKLGVVFHQDAAGVALLITCFTLPSAFMTPVAGVLADRFGRKAVLLPGLLLFACGGMGCAFSDSFENLLAWRAIQGLGAAPLGILYGTLVGDFYKEADRPKVMGMVGATISFGTALYPAIGGFLGEMDWRWPFWISLAALPVGLLALSVPLERPHTGMDWKQYARDSRSIIFHSAAIGLFGLTFLCFCILYGPTITYFPLLADLLYKATPSHIGSRLYRGFAGYGGHCHESGVARAEILAPPFDAERYVLLRRGSNAHACSSRRRVLALVADLAHFHRRSGAGADVPLAERPYDHACPNAQQGHRHGYERYGAAA